MKTAVKAAKKMKGVKAKPVKISSAFESTANLMKMTINRRPLNINENIEKMWRRLSRKPRMANESGVARRRNVWPSAVANILKTTASM